MFDQQNAAFVNTQDIFPSADGGSIPVFTHLTVSRSGGCVTLPVVHRLAVSSRHTPDRTHLIALTAAHRTLQHHHSHSERPVTKTDTTKEPNVYFSPDSRLRPARTRIREAHSCPPPRVWRLGRSAARSASRLPECKAPAGAGRPCRTSPDTDVNGCTNEL